jgi:hypothetical protein
MRAGVKMYALEKKDQHQMNITRHPQARTP